MESGLTAIGPVLCCRNKLGKRKGHSHGAAPSKRAAVRQEVRVTCGSSSGVYDITRGCIALRAAQHGQVCFTHSFIHSSHSDFFSQVKYVFSMHQVCISVCFAQVSCVMAAWYCWLMYEHVLPHSISYRKQSGQAFAAPPP